MADERATAKDADYVLISMSPDVCFTGSKVKKKLPLPFPIVHNMASAQQCSDNVFINGEPAFMHAMSYVDDVHGDELGTGGGIVSTVNMEVSHSEQRSSSVFINGFPMVRTGDMVFMNTKKP
jgi:uncharacterized Zn-binding protein involved in type VI secretion